MRHESRNITEHLLCVFLNEKPTDSNYRLSVKAMNNTLNTLHEGTVHLHSYAPMRLPFNLARIENTT